MKLKLPFSKGAFPVSSNRKSEKLRQAQDDQKRHPELVEGSRGYARPSFSKGG
jgi:hypothetical protein